MQMKKVQKKSLLKQRANDTVKFEVGQEIGFLDEGNKIGLTQPTTGADTLTKTDHGNYAEFNSGDALNVNIHYIPQHLWKGVEPGKFHRRLSWRCFQLAYQSPWVLPLTVQKYKAAKWH